MNRDEAMMRLCAAFGVDPALADFNIVAVNCVLDSLEAAEREACANVVEKTKWSNWFQADAAAAIRARSQS
jgi:hypothetical protein